MQDLRLLSYNIHRAHSLLRKRLVTDEIHGLIAQYDADVVCLQEVWRTEQWSSSKLEQLCAEGWGHASYLQSVSFPNGSQGNAILSRLPIIEEHKFDLTVAGHEPRIALCCRLATGEHHSHGLWVVCVHFGLKRDERRTQWQAMQAHLKQLPSKDSLIIAGDWNDWDLRLHRAAIAEGFDEAFFKTHGRLARTFPSFAPLLKLDRIYSRNLTPSVAQINGYGRQGWPSDHLAYAAHFPLS